VHAWLDRLPPVGESASVLFDLFNGKGQQLGYRVATHEQEIDGTRRVIYGAWLTRGGRAYGGAGGFTEPLASERSKLDAWRRGWCAVPKVEGHRVTAIPHAFINERIATAYQRYAWHDEIEHLAGSRFSVRVTYEGECT
jgi:hypothetical protein